MISFVGAGPGAADLITLRGAERLATADVVVWASSLVPAALLDRCSADAAVHDSATMTLEDVLAVYAAHDDGAAIVRLHSGDPSLYGAIQEQIDWCRTHDRTWEIVPGVSSVSAASALAGRELTIPGVSQTVVLTRLAGRTAASMPADTGVAAFARHGATMAILLSAARPDELQAELLGPGSAYRPDTPAVIVVRGTWPDEQVVHTTVGALADDIRATGAAMTVLVLVGDALATGDAERRSHLYAPAYTTTYRLRSTPGTATGRPSARPTPGIAGTTTAAEHPGHGRPAEPDAAIRPAGPPGGVAPSGQRTAPDGSAGPAAMAAETGATNGTSMTGADETTGTRGIG